LAASSDFSRALAMRKLGRTMPFDRTARRELCRVAALPGALVRVR
jgi:hypothetical protein